MRCRVLAPFESPSEELVLCIGGRALQSALAVVLRPRNDVRWCPTADAAARALRDRPASFLVVEIGTGVVASAASVIGLARDAFANVVVCIYCWMSPYTGADVASASRSGIDMCLFRGYGDDPATLRRFFDVTPGTSPHYSMLDALLPLLHPVAAGLACYVSANPRCAQSVDQVARGVGITARTLERRFARAGLPAPSSLLAGLRGLIVAQLTARHVPRDTIVRAAGFQSARAMNAAIRRWHGVSTCVLAAQAHAPVLIGNVLAKFAAPGGSMSGFMQALSHVG
jgi:AraC-like DNA-binding protein